MLTRGRGVAVIQRTGQHSGLGRIAALIAAEPIRQTPLQQRLTRLSRAIVVGVLVLTGWPVGQPSCAGCRQWRRSAR